MPPARKGPSTIKPDETPSESAFRELMSLSRLGSGQVGWSEARRSGYERGWVNNPGSVSMRMPRGTDRRSEHLAHVDRHMGDGLTPRIGLGLQPGGHRAACRHVSQIQQHS
jgi:hypothetical protein